MTESVTPPPAQPTPVQQRTRGWIKILLAVSLALNLAVAGMAIGAFLRNGGPPQGRDDMGLGPLADALAPADRRALRKAFIDHFPDLRKGREALRADFDALLAALRAEPFDPVALDAALTVIATRNTERLDSGRDIIADYLKTMPDAARAAFADRLEKALERAARWGRHKERKDD
jgi:uncharacterized membrane protein